MKNMKYFIRPEHFNAIGKLMLMVSMAWAYFYFNDYLVPWYGGDKWEKLLQEFTEKGPLWWLWYLLLICNIVIPWLILWRQKWRSTPWLLAAVGVVINIGMWVERYVIIPEGLTIALFLLLYMLASRVIPLVPIWEVQEGQIAHTLRRVGKAEVRTLSEIE
jgi:hypothetical protein